LVALSIGLVWAYIRNKITPMPLMIGLLVLSSFDLLALDQRYLSHENYIEADELQQALVATQADTQIQADPNKPFRVFDYSDEINGPWNSSRASYFHNAVSGYHPAKLALYQDLIERQLGNNNMNVFNMLNTKYFIGNNPATQQPQAQINPDAFGPVWLVKQIHYVKTADDEMRALNTVNRDTAIVQEKFRNAIKLAPRFDSAATITVKDYLNDKITYDFNAASDQFAVFSEIYYPRGWRAFIDGKESEIIKVNYALRGLAVPAGKHTIEFRFEPAAYKTGNTVMLICTIIAFALLAAAIFFTVRKKQAKA
ncbi:MAG TPA: YfhO family protein, partial [Chitinophagaceae bacterium]|nr:YfhO family protein [Chitinophagaceae bacterium]